MTAIIDRRRMSRIRGRRFRAPWPTVNGCSGPGARTSSSLSWLPPRWSGGTIGSGLPAIGGRFFSRTLTARPRKWLSLFDAARDDAFHDPPIQQEYENRRDSDCNDRGRIDDRVGHDVAAFERGEDDGERLGRPGAAEHQGKDELPPSQKECDDGGRSDPRPRDGKCDPVERLEHRGPVDNGRLLDARREREKNLVHDPHGEGHRSRCMDEKDAEVGVDKPDLSHDPVERNEHRVQRTLTRLPPTAVSSRY